MPDHEDRADSPARPDRRLAAILVADVVGYSRLMEQDEEGTHALLQSLLRAVVRPTVSAHHGRLVKSTGDGLIAEFASPVEAVRCATVVQQAIAEQNAPLAQERRIMLRIGVNLGDILIEDGDVYGDGVNIAARLEGLADAGGILISQTIHDHVNGRLPLRFEDLGERALKNIVRPVRCYRVGSQERAPARSPAAAPAVPDLPNQTSIAVLPFVNMSSDAEQEFFADGLTEDLITDLSKIPGLLVIARNSTFVYKGKATDIRTVAKDLGVRYVIEGSVRRAAGRVRINAQLIEAAGNIHLWADRFDRELADIFVLQDEVVGKIMTALADVLPVKRAPTRQRTADVAAYDLFIRGRALIMQSPGSNRAAYPLLEAAIEKDPAYADAQAWLAMSHLFGWMYWGEADEHRHVALDAARRATALDPENADAHMVLGYAQAYEGDLESGLAEFATALRINPNHADAWAFLADLTVWDGRADAAIDCARKAFRLNPYPPEVYYWLLAYAQYAARRYQDGVDTLGHDAALGPGSLRILASCLAQLGRLDEARDATQRYLAVIPHFSANAWGRTQHFRNNGDRQHFIEGYLKAGLPA
jgi:adenylate cyclase